MSARAFGVIICSKKYYINLTTLQNAYCAVNQNSTNMNSTSIVLPLAPLCFEGTNSTIYLVGESNQSISLCHLFFLSSANGSNFHNSPKTEAANSNFVHLISRTTMKEGNPTIIGNHNELFYTCKL